VAGYGAVEPNGIGVGHVDGESGWRGLVAGEESTTYGLAGARYTLTLDDGMARALPGEDYFVAYIGRRSVW